MSLPPIFIFWNRNYFYLSETDHQPRYPKISISASDRVCVLRKSDHSWRAPQASLRGCSRTRRSWSRWLSTGE